MSIETVFKLALNKLRSRSYFSQELKRKLKQEGSGEEEIEGALEKLKSLGFINDEERLEGLVHYAQRQGKGPYWVKKYLYDKGASFPDASLLALYTEEQQMSAIAGILRKAPKDPIKVIPFLARRGFLLTVIHKALNK